MLSMYDFFIALKLAELKSLIDERGATTMAETKPSRTAGLAQEEGSLAPPASPPTSPTASPDSAAATATSLAPPAASDTGADAPVGAATGGRPEASVGAAAAKVEVRRDANGRRDDRREFSLEDLAARETAPVSVIVLTYNEEGNIRACLESCAWCDDVHVLDSGSKDRTREIAEEMGATVHVNAFRSFGQQRNWAIDNIPVKYKWQFQVDADERFTPALVREMGALLRADGSSVDGASAYQCPSMMMFMGRWLRHAAEFPVYQCRLLNPDSCRFEDYGHGQREVNRGKTGVLRMPYMHYNFSKGLEEWFDKHNRYSSLEASQALAEPPMRTGRAIATMFRGNSVSRRRALKAISYRLPAKSLIVFFWTIVIRRGFLDGVAGWNYARMRSIYEGMMSVKVSVLKRKGESK
ncbi:MAG: glycosyltransferase family 2 protein [Phycisphaerales bacterium]